MIREFQKSHKNSAHFFWWDIHSPTQKDFEEISKKIPVRMEKISHCFENEQLPRFFSEDSYQCIVLRVYDENVKIGETVQNYSNRIIVFFNREFVLTLHRHEVPCLHNILENGKLNSHIKSTHELVLKILKQVILSFEKPIYDNETEIDLYDVGSSQSGSAISILNEMYYIKRFTSTARRILWKTDSILSSLVEIMPEQMHLLKLLKENSERLHNLADELDLTAQNITTLQISIATYKSSEVMKTLTIFSIFFMPLTFIVGVYGMNFQFMPELHWKYGYPILMAFMFLTFIVMYFWMKKKGFFGS